MLKGARTSHPRALEFKHVSVAVGGEEIAEGAGRSVGRGGPDQDHDGRRTRCKEDLGAS